MQQTGPSNVISCFFESFWIFTPFQSVSLMHEIHHKAIWKSEMNEIFPSQNSPKEEAFYCD